MDQTLKILLWLDRHLETPELVSELASRMEPAFAGHEVVICKDEGCALREIESADVMFGYRILPEMLERAKKLKWIQFGSAGIDHTVFPKLLDSDIILTTFSGVHPVPLAEHVLGMMLALSRNIEIAVKQQTKHQWNRSTIAGSACELRGKTAGIIGLGKIGLEIAKLCKCFGMTVIGTKATPSEYLPNVDEILLPPDLDHMLRRSDFLVLVVPLTTATSALLGPREVRLMKHGAYLVNVARGQMVDNGAMIHALQTGRLAGVALDVFSTEPLPEDSPLWDAPNTLITPHVGGATPRYAERGAVIFRKNLEAFISGGEMVNVYDRSKGY